MYDIYYAHHQWKYGTREEEYELSLIRRYFPLARIFNPAIDLKTTSTDETEIMKECLETVKNSDIVDFSSLDGCVGTGVYHEVTEAQRLGKIVFYISHDHLYTSFEIEERPKEERTDRLYGFINCW